MSDKLLNKRVLERPPAYIICFRLADGHHFLPSRRVANEDVVDFPIFSAEAFQQRTRWHSLVQPREPTTHQVLSVRGLSQAHSTQESRRPRKVHHSDRTGESSACSGGVLEPSHTLKLDKASACKRDVKVYGDLLETALTSRTVHSRVRTSRGTLEALNSALGEHAPQGTAAGKKISASHLLQGVEAEPDVGGQPQFFLHRLHLLYCLCSPGCSVLYLPRQAAEVSHADDASHRGRGERRKPSCRGRPESVGAAGMDGIVGYQR